MPDAPFLLVLQHDRNTDANKVLVAPLTLHSPPSRRNVALEVAGRIYVMTPLDLAPVDRAAIGPPVANLAHESFRIQTALDIVFSAAG